MRFAALYATLGLCANAERIFTNVEFLLPRPWGKARQNEQPQSSVSSSDMAVFLTFITGQETRVKDLDDSGALVNALLSTRDSHVPLQPKIVVVTTVNEQDRQRSPPTNDMLWSAPGSGSLDDILTSVQNIGVNVTPAQMNSNQNNGEGGLFYGADHNLCSRLLAAETGTIAQTAVELTPWMAGEQTAPLLVSVNPSRVTDCMRAEDWDANTTEASASTLLQMVAALQKAAEDASQGNALIARVYYKSTGDAKHQEWWNTATPPAFTPGTEGDDDVYQVVARRLQDEEAPPSDYPIPYSVVLWVCVAMAGFVVAAVLPLWWLSDLDDPVIDTKLFAASH